MKKTMLLAFASVLAVSVSAQAGSDQAYLGIFAETTLMKIAGMKPINLPAGIPIPAAARAHMPGQAHRTLTVRLWSPSIAPDSATASIAPPAGLQQGDKLDLELYRPASTAASGGGGEPGEQNPQDTSFTIKVYWGSSDTVQTGQPKIITFGGLTPEQQQEMHNRMNSMRPGAGSSYFYKAGWTTGYWPTQSQPGQISDTASLVGTYSLSTNYAGNVTIDDPQDVDFLAPIDMTSPDLSQKPDLNGSIPFQWTAIPNALGEFAAIYGMEGKNTLILWTSSDVYNDRLMGDMGYLQMSEVKDMVSQHLFMPGDASSMTVPAGIFKDCDFVMLNMVGYGPGTAKDNVQPLPRIQTKTTLQVMLGGKKMQGMDRGAYGG